MHLGLFTLNEKQHYFVDCGFSVSSNKMLTALSLQQQPLCNVSITLLKKQSVTKCAFKNVTQNILQPHMQ